MSWYWELRQVFLCKVVVDCIACCECWNCCCSLGLLGDCLYISILDIGYIADVGSLDSKIIANVFESLFAQALYTVVVQRHYVLSLSIAFVRSIASGDIHLRCSFCTFAYRDAYLADEKSILQRNVHLMQKYKGISKTGMV